MTPTRAARANSKTVQCTDMTGAEWTGLAKLVLEVATKVKEAVLHGRDHTLSFTALIDLHDKLGLVKKTTDNLRASYSDPSPYLDFSSDAIPILDRMLQESWLRSCHDFFRALARVDRAIIRVYSPELSSYLDDELPNYEFGFMRCELERHPHRWVGQEGELAKLYEQIETFLDASHHTGWTPKRSDPVVDLQTISDALEEASAQLSDVIKQHWPSPK